MKVRKFLFLLKRPPQGGVIDQELFDQLLTLAAFDQELSVLFLGEGIYRLFGDDNEGARKAAHAGLLDALSFYGIESVWVEIESMAHRGLSLADAAIQVKSANRDVVTAMLAEHDVILGD